MGLCLLFFAVLLGLATAAAFLHLHRQRGSRQKMIRRLRTVLDSAPE